MKYALLCLLLICTLGTARAKESFLRNYTQKDGLPSNTVFDIYQDEEGYIWFATDKGVSRYDGLNFQNFTTSDGLPGNICYYFRKDSQGRMWVGVSNGSPVFYRKGKWYTAQNTPYLRMPFSGGVLGDIVEAKDGTILLTFQNRNVFASFRNNALTTYNLANCQYLKDHKATIETAPLDIRYVDSNHFLVVFYRFTLLMDRNYKVLRKTDHPYVFLHIVGREKEYYLTPTQIVSQDFQTVMDLPDHFLNHNYWVNRLFEQGNEQFLCTNNGIFLGKDTLLKGNRVTTVFVDREGYYWVSTDGNGVYKMSKRFRASDAFPQVYEGKVNFAQATQNVLLFSTLNRDLYRLKNGVVQKIFDFSKHLGQHPLNDNIGHLVIGNNYLNLTAEQSVCVQSFDKPPTSISVASLKPEKTNVNAVFRTARKIVLKGRREFWYTPDCSADFFLKNWRTLSFIKLKDPDTTRDLNVLLDAVMDTADQIWFSSLNGTYVLDGTQCRFQTQLGKHPFVRMVLLKNYLVGITQYNQFIVCRDYRSATAKIDSSFKNDCVWEKLYKLNDHTLIATTNGNYRIFQLDPTAPEGYRLKVLENEFVPQLADYIYSDNSTCYFFKDQSIYTLPVTDLLYTDPAPLSAFTYLKTLRRTVPAAAKVELNYAESRSITVYYSTVSLHSDKITYEYSIATGKEPAGKWQVSGPGVISLTNIGYGTYTVKTRVKTFGGTYSRESSIQLVIGRPFWLQWWFLALVLAASILIVFLIISYLFRRKAKEKEREIRFLKSEFTALNALMNPHFVFNSLNSVQSLINKNDRLAASEYIRTISDLLRQNMYNISSDMVTLEKEMMLVENYLKLEKLRFKDRLSYVIDIDETTDMDIIMVPPLIIQPLVENAIKYGIWQTDKKDGMLSIRVYPDQHHVYIDVTDNGNGFTTGANTEGKHQSTAIKNIRKRLEQLSAIHNKKFSLSIEELKHTDGSVSGVRSRIVIE